MATPELHSTIVERMDSLNKAISEQRKIDGEVRSLKAEVATLNARLAVSDESLNTADLTRLIGQYLDAW